MAPEFLTVDEVLDIHRDQIERYGGADGLRDANGLLAAIGSRACRCVQGLS